MDSIIVAEVGKIKKEPNKMLQKRQFKSYQKLSSIKIKAEYNIK